MPAARVTLALVTAAALLGASVALFGAFALGGFGKRHAEVAKTDDVRAGRSPASRAEWSKLYASRVGSVVTVLATDGHGVSETRGAGFVVDAATGRVVTSAHVVTDSSHPHVAPAAVRADGIVYIERADEARVVAHVVGYDLSDDIAVLRFDPHRLRIPRAPLGRAPTVRVGDPIAVIGAPFGQRNSLSVGVVSQIGVELVGRTPACFRAHDLIQLDALIYPRDSGGPLLDAHGRVIGVTSQIAASDSSTAPAGDHIAAAIPIGQVRRSVALIEGDLRHVAGRCR